MFTVPAVTVMILVIVISCIFTLTNGLHDASSIVATIITSGAATPRAAILLASIFGLAGAVFGGSLVAHTISSIVELPPSPQLLSVLFSAVLGAVVWNVITWRLGLPSSSSHALIGGIIGAVLVSNGNHILWGGRELIAAGHDIVGVVKIVLALFISPIIGFAFAYIFEGLSKILLRNAKTTINKSIKRLQWVSAAGFAYSHGANDTQKILGIVILALASGGNTTLQSVPVWARLCFGAFIFIGTLFGGWSIVKTIGRGIFQLKPIHSLNSQLASAGMLLLANLTGAPVSSTHVVVSSVMGVGAAENHKMVNWYTVRNIIASWFITIPISAAVAAGIYLIVNSLISPV